MSQVIELILNFITKEIIGILNILIAFFLLKEAKKMREIATDSELVYSLQLIDDYTVIGKLENIGNGVAYNIEVASDVNFSTFYDVPINEAFKSLEYLAPKHSYYIKYGYLNINNEIIPFEDHNVTLKWTQSKSVKRNKRTAQFFISGNYFKNTPGKVGLKEVVDAIENLGSRLGNSRNIRS